MSLILPTFDSSVLVREADAEAVGRAPTTVRLLADSGDTGGALSTQRVTLADGADGAGPHRTATRPRCSTCSTAPRNCCAVAQPRSGHASGRGAHEWRADEDVA